MARPSTSTEFLRSSKFGFGPLGPLLELELNSGRLNATLASTGAIPLPSTRYSTTTRSSRNQEPRETHRQTSEMHLAILGKDLPLIKKLISTKGDKLCIGKGLNCFVIAIMNNHHQSSRNFIKELLQIEPLGAKAKNTDGYCLLLKYISDVDFVKFLLHLGADPSAACDKGSALMCAVSNLDTSRIRINAVREVSEVVYSLINAGANVLAEDEKGCTVLCHLIRIAANYPHAQDLLQYLLNQAPFQSETLSLHCSTPELTPQVMLLQQFCSWKDCSRTYDLIFNSRLKNVNGLYMTKLHEFSHYIVQMNVIGYVIRIAQILDTRLDFLDANFIDKLIFYGFEVANPHGVSPLTILMFHSYYFNSPYTEPYDHAIYGHRNHALQLNQFFETCLRVKRVEHISQFLQLQLQLAKKVVEQGANVQQIMLQSNDNTLEQRRRDMFIPDALWIAFLLGNFSMVDGLLPHCVCPPLSILLTHFAYTKETIDTALICLEKYGPVPHGTRLYKDLYSLIRSKGSYEAIHLFKRIHSSPLSLQELCRYRVRSALGKAASRPENTLSDLVSYVAPFLLRNYIMDVPLSLPSKPQPTLIYELDITSECMRELMWV